MFVLLKGMTDLRFKPAYNPYTEPSLEIFAFHKGFIKFFFKLSLKNVALNFVCAIRAQQMGRSRKLRSL